jgi:ribosomal protein S18 acetylase RimI-like enzyme
MWVIAAKRPKDREGLPQQGDEMTTIAGISMKEALTVRQARSADIPHVIALDARITGLAKPDYWHDAFARYSEPDHGERFFLVATPAERSDDAQILGFIIGEIRAWEFGSEPCGWVFALSVEPKARLHGIGQALFAAISAKFKKAGMTKMRTMVARDNRLHLLFFRGEGMMAGPYIQLEKEFD